MHILGLFSNLKNMCLGCVLKVLLWGWYPAWNTSVPPSGAAACTHVLQQHFSIVLIKVTIVFPWKADTICLLAGLGSFSLVGHKRSFILASACIWNALLEYIPALEERVSFKRRFLLTSWWICTVNALVCCDIIKCSAVAVNALQDTIAWIYQYINWTFLSQSSSYIYNSFILLWYFIKGFLLAKDKGKRINAITANLRTSRNSQCI